ncbi:Copper sensory histidine kinase CusS (plasmid) [Cupriavidus sp. U2]|uniref:heavy metal sensor histidine kinase n=1 Tax=Cupriavidus sp. U2 TaxID=2920269 RepID=UPI00129DECB0|nr:heavy metal sensor histidine kinase [Cupriavidus sp. U2]KAI3592064.1 Copper sensory histidine kinase CusS [Cupriavidus sp. U2]
MRRRLSLTTRLTLLFSFSSAVVLSGLGVLIWLAMDRHFANEDYVVLGDSVRLIQKITKESPSANTRAQLEQMLEHHPGFVARVQAESGGTLYQTKGFDFALALNAVRTLGKSDDNLLWRQDGRVYRGMQALATTPSDNGKLHILVGMDTDIHAHFMDAFCRSLAFYITLAVMASGLFGWWAARRGLAPLRTMAARASGVTSHKLDARMPVETVPVEMADLAVTLNAMLGRLQEDFRRLTEFSSDIAHELRTPLTNLMTQTQVALSQPRNTEKYREVLASNAEELQRLCRMVSDMLYLAKMEHGLTLPSEEAITISEEVKALFEFYDALAEDKGISLSVQGDAHVWGDRLMLRRALSNLLSNALRYTPRGKAIVVTASEEDGTATLVVENQGPEINPELLPSLFDRFFRADKSRNRADAEGVGLGLSITKAILTAHGGTIFVQSHGGHTRFVMTFPQVAK